MQFDGAVVKEQGVVFAIVIVKQSATQNSTSSNEARDAFQGYFPGMPLVLASQDAAGRFTYQGRKDIVAFLAQLDPRRIPWKKYTSE
jgi:hypothetical protein